MCNLMCLFFSQFLTRLSELLGSASSTHSIFVNHKRVSREGSSGQWPIVVRATDGKGKANQGRIKFSTHVSVHLKTQRWKIIDQDMFVNKHFWQIEPSHLVTFQAQYTTILRSSFASFLKKRDKAKERRVDKLLKEKRKKMEETNKIKVTAVGSSEYAKMGLTFSP